jgi:hypothetical protein
MRGRLTSKLTCPPPKDMGSRIHSIRDILSAVFYVLRACLVNVRVRMVLYAFSYEKAVSDRPFRH